MDDIKDILVEFALAAKPLLNDDKFFDKDGKPQEGTELLEETAERLRKVEESQANSEPVAS